MDPALRQVTQLPLRELWDEHGFFGRRVAELTRAEVLALVSKEPVRFVEANVGEPLRWVGVSECFFHWKAVAPNIGGAERFHLDDFPGQFVFIASVWVGRLNERIILLEMHH